MKLTKDVHEKIIDDLNSRGAGVVAFIIAHYDKSLQVVQYEMDGSVVYVSEKLKDLQLSTQIGDGVFQQFVHWDTGGRDEKGIN